MNWMQWCLFTLPVWRQLTYVACRGRIVALSRALALAVARARLTAVKSLFLTCETSAPAVARKHMVRWSRIVTNDTNQFVVQTRIARKHFSRRARLRRHEWTARTGHFLWYLGYVTCIKAAIKLDGGDGYLYCWFWFPIAMLIHDSRCQSFTAQWCILPI